LADVAGTHASVISQLETGKSVPAPWVIERLGKILGLPTDAYEPETTISDLLNVLDRCTELPDEIRQALTTLISAYIEEE
jgi:transcriptional regulator with XRE-family HTH domain